MRTVYLFTSDIHAGENTVREHYTVTHSCDDKHVYAYHWDWQNQHITLYGWSPAELADAVNAYRLSAACERNPLYVRSDPAFYHLPFEYQGVEHHSYMMWAEDLYA